jgi:CheY-like chemotaxis protein
VADYRLRDGRNGIAEARRLQAEYGGELPVLVVTGDSAPERVAELQGSGLPWLPKPVPAARLRSWLGQARRHAATPADDELEESIPRRS